MPLRAAACARRALLVGICALLVLPSGAAAQAGRRVVVSGDLAALRHWDAEVARLERSGRLRVRATLADCQVPARRHEVLAQYAGGLRVAGAEIRRQRAGGVTHSLAGVLWDVDDDHVALLRGQLTPHASRDPGDDESGAREIVVAASERGHRLAWETGAGALVDALTGETISERADDRGIAEREAACVLRSAGLDSCAVLLGVADPAAACRDEGGVASTPRSGGASTRPDANATSAPSGSTILWDPNDDGTVGYRVLVGQQSGVYTTVIDVGGATSWRIALAPAAEYFAAVEAYDAFGRVSPPSSEVRFAFGHGAPAADVPSAVANSLSPGARALLSRLPVTSGPTRDDGAAGIWRALARIVTEGGDERAVAGNAVEGRVLAVFNAVQEAGTQNRPEGAADAWRALTRRLAARMMLFLLPADADESLFAWAAATAAADLDRSGRLRAAVEEALR